MAVPIAIAYAGICVLLCGIASLAASGEQASAAAA
jgi:hypothetical protein